jgi:hypothetical protein
MANVSCERIALPGIMAPQQGAPTRFVLNISPRFVGWMMEKKTTAEFEKKTPAKFYHFETQPPCPLIDGLPIPNFNGANGNYPNSEYKENSHKQFNPYALVHR